jgi:iron complex outermembrane recepter protein
MSARFRRCFAMFVLIVSGVIAAPAAFAQTSYTFNLPEQSLADSLRAIGQQTEMNILFEPEAVKNTRSPALKGQYTVDEAIRLVLVGTKLEAQHTAASNVVIKIKSSRSSVLPPTSADTPGSSGNRVAQTNSASPQSPSATGPQNTDTSDSTSDKKEGLSEIIVTGTHIHNVAPISPVITITHDDIVRQGYTTIAEVIEQLPQNFLGAASPAANPISGFGGSSGTSNLTFESSINLRGLGPNATLVLLNGRRMAPEAITGAVDISEIPVNAIDRIEIVTDGASSVYGADAVAGVVNIITRQDFSGVQVGAGLTGISDGKAPNNNVNVLGGFSWNGGGLVASGDFEKDNPLFARNRYFTDQLPDPWALTPKNETSNLYLTLHQEFSDQLTLSGDVLATRRSFEVTANEFGPILGPSALPSTFSGRVSQYNASLELDYRISSEWSLAVIGQASKEQEQTFNYFPALGAGAAQPSDYRVASLESRIDGKLFDAPGGAARAAIGAQFRREDLDTTQYNGTLTDPTSQGVYLQAESSRHEASAYGELVLPLIGKENAMLLAQELRIDFSGRYDDYSDFGHTSNPRVGLQWKPVSGVTLHGTYSRSFQVPTLWEASPVNQSATVGLIPDPQSASGSTVTLLTGGNNPNLQPEKAKSLNFGVSYEPNFVSGLKLDASYFSIHFDNRIIQLTDLGISTNALQQASILGSLVERNPSLSQITEALNVPMIYNIVDGNYGIGLGPYAPSDIKAIVPTGYINASTDDVAGEDLAVHYMGPDLSIGRFRADVDASLFNRYNYVLAPGAPTTSYLNTVLNPLRLRAKANVGWAKNGWGANARLNFSNKYRNATAGAESFCADQCSISSWTTFDFGLSYAPLTGAVPRWLEDTRFAVIVTNAFNRAPPSVTGLSPGGLGPTGPNFGYDPFNANPLLRTFGITFTKRWGGRNSP